MKRAAIVLHGWRSDSEEVGAWLTQLLASLGIEVFAREADAKRIGGGAGISDLEEQFDVMFALGGDGTFLRAAELAAGSRTPLLGINLGRIGFLTELERSDVEHTVQRLISNGIATTTRLTLSAEIDNEVSQWALNEISISKLDPGRLIKLSIRIAGELLTTIAADGIIVATPTGSTAYSFSSGGPIVSPDVDGIVITPVSPHLSFDRAVIVPASEPIEVEIASDSDAVGVSADGKGWVRVAGGSKIHIKVSDRPLLMVNIDGRPFWSLVRTKFHLPGTEDSAR